MRQTSFVTATPARPLPIALGLWVLALALFALAALAFQNARQIEAEAVRLEQHAVSLDAELRGLGIDDGAVPTEDEFDDLARRIARLNDLSGQRHVALPVLLETIEGIVPDDVWVGQITYHVDTGALTVSLLSENENALVPALRAFEAAETLEDLILEQQIRVQSGTRNLLQYDIRAQAR